ncbi:MAG TPA: asparagine synthase (glutamine-hydrolyzing) [Agriterribacter sp.]|nr:asparagine synthase (glutamine-hydrolyzing) [Chitinophagaceae bacterium]HRP31657.1 asparagine synthase (glutamine-hydrolyzing) [Agriterribacter sp.]
MCGFAGIINNDFSVHQKQLADIAACVRFRGPDSSGIRIYDTGMQPSSAGIHALFFNRLAIMDIDHRSDQPFEDERYTLLFNGEIYNYKNLRDELVQNGFHFHTTSDTEVLFYGLQHWGTKILERLNGMFAFCFIDRAEKRFIVARDRLGIKPLYYMRSGSGFVFASELYSLLRLSQQSAIVDTDAVRMYLWMQCVPTPYTGVKDAWKLPPGTYITGSWLGEGPVNLSNPDTFWDAYQAVQQKESASSNQNLEQILTGTLHRQLVADVPLGLFLSSGVDSSLLAALVNKYFTKDRSFNFYTVAFSEATDADESRDAVHFIEAFNNPALQSHTLMIDASFIGEQLDRLYDFVDEPFADPAVLLNMVISKKAREQVTVALSGDGADELFWGYTRYRYWQNRMVQLGGRVELKNWQTQWASHLLPMAHHRQLAALAAESDPVKRHFNYFLHPFFKNEILNPIFETPIWAMRDVDRVRRRDDLTAVLDVKTYLADAMLFKVDRASMAASLEVRVPYLDNAVVDYALGLPLQEKSNANYNHKAPLKHLLQQLAPHYALHRPKKGFSFPLNQWLSTTWKERAMDMIRKDSLHRMQLNDRKYLPMLQQYYSGTKRNCLPVWYVLNLMMWNRKLNQIKPLQQA